MGVPKPKKYRMERNYQAVGQILRNARLKKKLTQREVGAALNVASAQYVSNFEAGIYMPPLKVLAQLVELYGMGGNELMRAALEAERELLVKSRKKG